MGDADDNIGKKKFMQRRSKYDNGSGASQATGNKFIYSYIVDLLCPLSTVEKF